MANSWQKANITTIWLGFSKHTHRLILHAHLLDDLGNELMNYAMRTTRTIVHRGIRGLCEDGRVFPVPNYQSCMDSLKRLGKKCGIDGNPLPSFEGEPKLVGIEGDIDTFTNTVWENLNADNKVSLFVRYIEIETGKYETRIINKNV